MSHTLTRIASELKDTTKVAARAALKAAALKQTLADDLLAEQARLRDLRSAKRLALINRRRPTGRPAIRLPSGTPQSRLAALRLAAVVAVYRDCYREATHGTLTVALTRDPAAVGIRQTSYDDWHFYAKSYHHPARIQDTTITVPADWRVRVGRNGLTTVDGLMTLDAAPLEGAPAGVELFAAVWLVQGRGTTVTATRGYIARSGYQTYHADSAEKALAGLRRKTRAADWLATLATADIAEWIARAPATATVRIADARAIGACDYGIRSWCASVGLDYAAGVAPLSAVYAAYQREPRREARAAIIYALRHSHSARA